MLEEKRDDIVVLLIRKMQGALFGRLKRKVYNKKKDQRFELFCKSPIRQSLLALAGAFFDELDSDELRLAACISLIFFREMIQVAQRNFRKYIVHRDWPWFVIIQKTRPLIGLPNPEEELRVLEEKATKAYGSYMEQLDTKAELEGENTALSTELDQMRQKMFAEQGDLGQYQERMAKASAQKADLEVQLEESRNKLQVGSSRCMQ